VFDFAAFDVVFDGGDERGGVLAQIVPGGLTTCSSSSMPRVNGSEDLKSGKGMAHSVVCCVLSIDNDVALTFQGGITVSRLSERGVHV
jgi:hypothetical protein